MAADIVDLFGVPLAAGEGALTGLALGGFGVDRATVIARRSDESLMDVTATARLALGTDIALAGSLESLAPGIRVALRTLSVEGFGQSARLTAPATITLEGPNIAASALAFDIGGGAVTLEGGRSDVWDVAVDIRALPLGIADLVVPDLAVTGTVSGAARITGPVATPDIDFNLSAETVGAAPLSALGLPPLSLVAEGRTDIATLQLDARLSGGSGLALLAAGAVPIGDGTLDLDIDLAALDLALLDQLAGGQGLSGRATGGAEISGTLAAPVAVFDLSAASVSARPLREAGIGPVAIAANGRFADDVLVLDTAEVNDAAARAGVQGRVDLAAERLDLTFNADMPLSLANPFVAAQSIQLGGQLTANGQVGGRFSAPEITGGIAVRSATIVDPLRNLRLDGVTLDARLTGREVLIDGLSGAFAAGGSVSANGRVALSPPLEAALNIQLSDVAYSNGETVSTVVSGTLGVNGALLSTPLVSGDIAIGRTEIAIPDSFGIREGVLLDLQHRGLPADTRLTLDRAGLLGGGELESRNTSRPAVRLDIQINAPNQIFVRGRGLDAEMGGGLRLLGTNADLAPQGQIDLIRGRVSLLGQRIDFTEGAVTATGDLNVRLRLIAETEVEDTDITLAIQGRARDPEFVLTSSPDLPQDEILALLIFRRELTSLSPLQVAQLASAAATLAGAGGGGLVSGFRNTAGLSNLDITTGEDGEIGVRAGAYISENVYLDLEAEADGDTRAIINIDITRDLKGRASFDNDGEGEIGIFFERDY
ncbi:MAG: translocation/assembly module TamB domain-containing protein [Pseudomonadota bacterium]